MNAQFKATNPETIKFTAEITGSLIEWKEVKRVMGQLPDSTHGEIYDRISDMISQAERTYYPEAAESGEGK